MGTVLQELNHDKILLYFVHKTLRPKEKEKTLFFIVNPANGPKKDIHFWNPKHDEYTSAFNLCQNNRENFIPEWSIRETLPQEIIQQANKSSKYWEGDWYKTLSKKLGDIKEFVENLESKINLNFNKNFPDIIGVSSKGDLELATEIKFEGFGKKALPQINNHYKGCSELEIPYYLVVPEKPFYGRFNKSFIKKILKEKPAINLYKFRYVGAIPNLDAIKFEKFE